jgi:predicted transcriptional regulator
MSGKSGGCFSSIESMIKPGQRALRAGCSSMMLNMKKNGKKNRGRLDIVRDVLSIALVKVRKTKIMYQASLNYAQLEKYLKTLLDGGLVECDGSCYLTTQKGREFLETYADHLERCSQIEKEVEGTARERRMLENMFFAVKNGGLQRGE